METFLGSLAALVAERGKEKLCRTCIVFPNRRANLFFRYHLSGHFDTPVWMPDLYSLEDFMAELSGLRMEDQFVLLVRLYKIYIAGNASEKQSFAEFITWGSMLLNDFDEIDQYLAGGVAVFSDIDEIKALRHWNLDGKPLTDFERKYLDFYKSLAPCYSDFTRALLDEKKGYFGLAFREVISYLSPGMFDRWDSVIFAGFNALTTAEKTLIDFLVKDGWGEVIWDADAYYLDDNRQEAGRFLRKIMGTSPEKTFRFLGNHFKQKGKKIHITGVPGNVGQAKYAGHLLKELETLPSDLSGVAVVLADESLLQPVLNSIPDSIPEYNITMGLPLRLTPVYSLIDAVFRLFISAGNLSSRISPGAADGLNGKVYYHRDILRLLNHTYLAGWNSGKPGPALKRPFYTFEELATETGKTDPGLGEIFRAHAMQMAQGKPVGLILSILEHLRKRYSRRAGEDEDSPLMPENQLQLEYLYHFAKIFSQLRILENDTDISPDLKAFYQVFSGLSGSSRLPFYGEPLRGIQVMGMLETRVLDFHTVILLSVNEGVLPKGRQMNTFIPEDVRAAFGLPTFNERNSVFAYHFYRLLQRAERIELLYNSEGNDLGGGEKSRFLSQIIHELPAYNPGIEIREQVLSIPPPEKPAGEILFTKDETVTRKLRELAQRGISPTAMSSYVACSLQFAFSYVYGLSEPDKVEESIDARTMGNAVHEALQLAYAPYLGKRISADAIQKLIPAAVRFVRQSLEKDFSADELDFGRNHMVVKVAGKFVTRFLSEEAAQAGSTGIDILGLEFPLEMSLAVPGTPEGEGFSVKLRGKADRIDLKDGVMRIIDYKTGRLEAKELNVADMDGLPEHKAPSKLIQLLTYALMFNHSDEFRQYAGKPLESGIISLRQTSGYFMQARINKNPSLDRDVLDRFSQYLVDLITEMFDAEVPFTRTDELSTCRNCAFARICNRTIA